MTDQQQAAEELFEAALDLPSDARPEFLDRACRDAPELRRSVERLLAEEGRLGDFLAGPILAGPILAGPILAGPILAGPIVAGPILAASNRPSSHSSNSQASTLVRSPSSPRFQPEDVIAARFQVVRYIARGGMGEVYEVRDQFLQGDNVALKIIRPDMAADTGSAHRFEREVILARKAHHPNLCPIYDIFRCDQPAPPFLFLTMKLLHGETLGALLKRGPIPLPDAVEMCNQLISGVVAMHEAGIVHRDLKPGNIMVEQTAQFPRVSIMDFGLARAHDGETTVTPNGAVAGTPGYMSPELLRGALPSKASDLFALGVVLHLALTGERPASAPHGDPNMASNALRRSGAPGYLVETTAGLLSPDPEERCRTFAGLSPAKVPRPQPVTGTVGTAPRSRGLTTTQFAVTAAVLFLAIALAAWLTQTREPNQLDSVQITSTTESKEGPLFTDGARLYFKSHGQLSQMSTAGGAIALLPGLMQGMQVMDITADGSRVLALDPDPNENIAIGKLWIASTIGGTLRRLSDHPARLGRFSRDGGLIVFTDHRSLYRIDSDGSDLRKFWTAPAAGFISDFALAPDARSLSLTLTMPWKPELWTVAIDGKDAHKLPLEWPDIADQFSGQWTPDGKHFLFLSSREGHLNIYELVSPRWFEFWKKPDGVRITGNQIDILAFAPSSDGKSVFALGTQEQGEMRAFNTQSRKFEPFLGGLSAQGFVISPDRQWMAYIDYPTGHLWKCRLDGSARSELTTSLSIMPHWSPDSRYLAYSNWTEIDMVSADGGASEKLVPATDPAKSVPPGVDDAVGPNWSPDGHSLYFNYFPYPDLPRTGIHVLDIKTRKLSVMPGSEGLFNPTWSPDGRYLVAANVGPPRILLFTRETQKWRELKLFDAQWASWAWSKDSKSLYVVSLDPHKGIYRLSVPDGSWAEAAPLDSINVGDTFDLDSFLSITDDGRLALMNHSDLTQVYSLTWKP